MSQTDRVLVLPEESYPTTAKNNKKSHHTHNTHDDNDMNDMMEVQ
jgi:hypothetical protein